MIKIENVSYSYETEENKTKLVLDNVSLEIEKGQFVTIIGHNGSGKSTLAKHLNGILVPSEGKVYVNGIDTSDEKTIWDVRSNVGMVFQNPDNQMVSTIVEDDVAFAPENLGVEHDEIVKRVEWALNAVGMYKMRSYAPHMLSGGQKQRVAIAGVLAMKPEYIVLDEPTAMLDPKGREEVLSAIHKLNREENITIILITHYMNEAADSDRVIVMDDGKIIMDDVPEKIFANVKELKEIGLDVPQVTELMYELRKEGIDAGNVLSVSEAVKELETVLAKHR